MIRDVVLFGVASIGVLFIRLLGQVTFDGNWWVEGGLGFLIVSSLVTQWVRAQNQVVAERTARDKAIADLRAVNDALITAEREYHRNALTELIDRHAEELEKFRADAVKAQTELVLELRDRVEAVEKKSK